MNAREKLDEFAEMTGMNKNQLIGWSIAADFAEWYAEQVKNCSIPAVVGRSEQLKAFLLFIQENAPNYRTKQLKPDQVIKAYLESL